MDSYIAFNFTMLVLYAIMVTMLKYNLPQESSTAIYFVEKVWMFSVITSLASPSFLNLLLSVLFYVKPHLMLESNLNHRCSKINMCLYIASVVIGSMLMFIDALALIPPAIGMEFKEKYLLPKEAFKQKENQF